MNLTVELWGDSLVTGVPGFPIFPILKEKNPDYTFINRGGTGDTLKSLYRRLKRNKDRPCDLAVLWIGTNDILVHAGPTLPFIKFLLRQHWSRTEKEFRHYYRKCLELLIGRSRQVMTIPPIMVGEQIGSRLNRNLLSLAGIIKELSDQYPSVRFCNLGEPVYTFLKNGDSSDFITKNSFGFIRDTLFFRSGKRIDKESKKRGLRLTLDGVHWNTLGARIVTDYLSEALTNGGESPPA